MSGYTPIFNGVFDGSLCGKYPQSVVWLIMLSQQDKNGEVDMSPERLHAVTGMPLEDLKKGISELEKPDPESRTPAEGGRRLVRIDPQRSWGWRLVNHEKYKEKARLMAKNWKEVASGENKKRQQYKRNAIKNNTLQENQRPPVTAGDRRKPPVTDPSSASANPSKDSLRSSLVTDPGGSVGGKPPPCPHQKIIDCYHQRLPMCRQVRTWGKTRQGYLTARWREDPERQCVEWWDAWFAYCARSEFLTGRTNGTKDRAPFVAGLAWLVRPVNFAEVLEGKYHD